MRAILQVFGLARDPREERVEQLLHDLDERRQDIQTTLKKYELERDPIASLAADLINKRAMGLDRRPESNGS